MYSAHHVWVLQSNLKIAINYSQKKKTFLIGSITEICSKLLLLCTRITCPNKLSIRKSLKVVAKFLYNIYVVIFLKSHQHIKCLVYELNYVLCKPILWYSFCNYFMTFQCYANVAAKNKIIILTLVYGDSLSNFLSENNL